MLPCASYSLAFICVLICVCIVAETLFCFTFVPYICPRILAPLSLEKFPCNFILATRMEIFLRILNSVKIVQKHGALYIKTGVRFDVSDDTESV